MSLYPDPRADGISTNQYCALLPKQRLTHEAQGLILLLPRTGLVVVPFELKTGGGWTVVVIDGSATYHRGGHHLFISKAEIESALELTIGEAAETRFVHTPEEADQLPDFESILTPGGIVYRKWEGHESEGQTSWCRFMYPPLRTDQLDADSHFPAKVLGSAPEKVETNV